MKRYDSYKDSGIEWFSEIPDHWKSIRLKNLFQESLEQNWDKKCTFYLSVLKDIGVIPYHEKGNKGNKISDDTSNYRLVKKDDIVVNSTNVCIGSVGISKYDGCLSSVMYIILRPKKLTNSEYYDYLFKIRTFQKHLRKISNGILEVREYLNKTLFKVELLPVPPLSEQQQIVSFLDSKTLLIDSLIEKTQRKIELLKEKRTSLINEVVTKGLNPNVKMKDSGVEWIGEIPSHWMRNKLNRISERIGDGLHSTPKYVDSSEYYFINGNNLVNGEIKIFDSTKCVSEEEFKKHFIQLNSKTLLLSINGTIGNLSFYNDEKVILGKSSCYINLKENINHHFVYYVLKSESISKYFTFELTGTTIFNLSLNSIRNTPIVIPPENEQQQIVEYLDEQTQLIDNTISIEEKRIELLKEYRQSLISEVVTGKRKVV